LFFKSFLNVCDPALSGVGLTPGYTPVNSGSALIVASSSWLTVGKPSAFASLSR